MPQLSVQGNRGAEDILLSVIVFNVLTFGLGDHLRVYLTAIL